MKQVLPAFLFYISVLSVFGQNYVTQYNGSAYVNCGTAISNSVSLANKITLETRFRMTTTPGSWDSPCGTYHDDSWTTGGFGLYYNGGTQMMNFYIFDYSSNNAAATFDPTNTSWHHIAGTWEQSTGVISIYIDGVLSGTDNYTGSVGPVTADIFQIGAAHSLYNWKGQLDEVRVWNVVRSQAEIADNMNTQLTGTETGLIAYYKMEEGSGTSLTDNTGLNNTGTMTEGVTWVGAPTISSFTPASAAAGTTVTINGALFTGTTAVSFGGTAAASITVNSDSQILAVVGSGSSGNVVVNAPGGTASYAGFTYILPTPTLSSFSPASAATGSTVTISGTNFTGATAVSFGGTAAASFSAVSATSITAVVAGGTTGTVSVTTPGGTATSTGTFTFLMAPPGNALALDGGNDFVNAGNGASVQISRGTLEAWIKTPYAGDSYRGIIVKQFAYALFLENNVLIAYQWAGGQGAISTGINLADNRWHHVALCFDNGAINGSFIYIDGELVKTFTYPLANQSLALGIGNGSAGNNIQNFQGSMDEVRVWNTVRTQSQLQSGMYTELAGTESGLVIYYNINQGIADGDNTGINTLNDLSGQANHGALTNFTKTGITSNFVESYALVVPVPAAATSNTGTGFTANWTAPAVGTVTSYLLDVSTSSTFGSFVTGYAALDCGTSLSQAVSGLTAGSTYYYRVRADKTSVTGTGGYYRTPATVTTSCTNPTSGGTIASSQTICAGFVPAAFTSTAAPSGQAGTLEYKWQLSTTSSSSAFADVASGNTAILAPGTLSATTWYKRLTRVNCMADWTGAVASNVLQITVNQPSFTPGTYTVTNLQATGTAIKWYLASSGGEALSSGTAISNGTTYYASQTVNGVESTQRMAVIATIDQTPCAPSGSATQSYSIGATIASLQASGSSIRWYAASSGGSALATSTVLVNGTHYYASQTISCTESATRLAVVVTIN
jgi:hypothetical protein